jgi:hypothetical protein
MAVKGGMLFDRSRLLVGRAKQIGEVLTKPFYMKNLRLIGWLKGTLLGALLLFAVSAAWAHGMGGGFHSSRGGGHFSGGHNFAFHHDGDHFFHHDRDRFFHHRHHFGDRFFFGFGFPYYGYPYDYYPYDYGYYDYYGATYGDQYGSDLTAAVQTELVREAITRGQSTERLAQTLRARSERIGEPKAYR